MEMKRFEKLMILGAVISAVSVYLYAVLEITFVPSAVLIGMTFVGMAIMVAPFMIVVTHLAIVRYERIFKN